MEVAWSVNPSTNAGRTDDRAYLCTPTQTASGHPYVNDVANLALNQGDILSQGMHLGGGFWTFWTSPDINDARINAEAYFPGPYSSSPFPLHRGIDNKARTPHPDHLVTDIRDEDFPVTPSSDSMSLTSYSGFSLSTDAPYTPPQSTLCELEGFVPGPTILIEDSPDPVLATLATTRNWVKESVTMHSPFYQDSPYTRSEATSGDSMPSALPVIPCVPADLQYEEQQASQDAPQRLQDAAKGPATESSRSSRRAPASESGTAKKQYACNICGKTYSQSQGVRRHQRETHKATLCKYCHSFEWGRPYRLRDHYRKHHPEVNIEVAMKESSKKRSKAKTNPKSIPQQVSLSSPPHGRQSRTESQPDCPLVPTFPPPAVMEFPSISPTCGVREDAEYTCGDDVKAGSQRTRQKKTGMAPGCGLQYRGHPQGF